jgi:sodium-dependent dicarboxylate transporter 2/3/5
MSQAEWRTGFLFTLLVTGWLLREQISVWTGFDALSDTGIALAAAILAFVIPSGTDRQALVTWEDTKRLPWGVLVLFGGGLALAAALSSSGLTLWLGQQLAPLGAINHVLLVVVLTALVVFLTELTSNVATTATLLPVVAALAVELGMDPLMFVVPVSIAASCAFMLPVATPPNAIVFSTGAVRIFDMVRAGFWLNIVAIILISVIALFLVPAVL